MGTAQNQRTDDDWREVGAPQSPLPEKPTRQQSMGRGKPLSVAEQSDNWRRKDEVSFENEKKKTGTNSHMLERTY
jgi:hypothetical protein